MRNLPIFCLAVVFGVGGSSAKTAGLLGPYIGASIGRSDVRIAKTVAGTAYPFGEDHDGWKAIVGIRPVSIFGGEVEYLDFGNPTYSPPMGLESWHTNSRATAVFGMLYAPIRGPFADVYAKLGIARLRSDVTTYYYGPIPAGFPCRPSGAPYCEGVIDSSATGLAFGAGVQFMVRTVAARLEYERIHTGIGGPSMASLGVTWTF